MRFFTPIAAAAFFCAALPAAAQAPEPQQERIEAEDEIELIDFAALLASLVGTVKPIGEMEPYHPPGQPPAEGPRTEEDKKCKVWPIPAGCPTY